MSDLKLTKDEFIRKAKELLTSIEKEYCDCWRMPTDIDYEKDDPCGRCHGMLYIEEGGDTKECESCRGAGVDREHEFDSDDFLNFMEQEVLADDCFNDLLRCKIIDKR